MAGIIGLIITGDFWTFRLSDGTQIDVIPVYTSEKRIQSFTHPNGAWLDNEIQRMLLEYCLVNVNEELDVESVHDLLQRMNPSEKSENDGGSSYKP
ncbi:hypothetical protein PO486_13900 [Atlantibacter hermannii]|uniref:hypothetical protein n=1 Tax=Atlantibacter hermannii TaxID=565 RepID=UPI0013EF0530|nr:hypothetical protein [Atlantibacter hermannii]MCQ4969168.1 hypothetical protein [Enterobacteriaceae bacterium DFI.7.85]